VKSEGSGPSSSTPPPRPKPTASQIWQAEVAAANARLSRPALADPEAPKLTGHAAVPLPSARVTIIVHYPMGPRQYVGSVGMDGLVRFAPMPIPQGAQVEIYST
jgi:hypothetical protein